MVPARVLAGPRSPFFLPCQDHSHWSQKSACVSLVLAHICQAAGQGRCVEGIHRSLRLSAQHQSLPHIINIKFSVLMEYLFNKKSVCFILTSAISSTNLSHWTKFIQIFPLHILLHVIAVSTGVSIRPSITLACVTYQLTISPTLVPQVRTCLSHLSD